MNVLIILIFSTLHGACIREISEIAKGFLVFNIVPQIAQMTQIFLLLFLSADETYSVRFSQTFTITSSRLYVWVGVKGVYKNFCIYIVRKR